MQSQVLLGPFEAPFPAGSLHKAGTGLGQGVRSALTWRSRRSRGRGRRQPGLGTPRRISRSRTPGRQGRPPPRLGPGASSRSRRNPVRWVRRAARAGGRSAQEREGERARWRALLRPRARVRPPPPTSSRRLLLCPHSSTRSCLRAGKAPS